MRRKILFLLVSALWFWNCNVPTFSGLTKGISQTLTDEELNLFRQTVLDEMNLVREKPCDYILDRLGANLPVYLRCAGEDNGLAQDLNRRRRNGELPVSPLVQNKILDITAGKYAQFLNENGRFDHFENGTPSDRCQADGYPLGCAENLAYQSSREGSVERNFNTRFNPELAGRNFVLQYLVDCQVPSLGHRKIILNEDYKSVGIGYSRVLTRNDQIRHMNVQNFGRLPYFDPLP